MSNDGKARTRRIGAEDSATRSALLDAAHELMIDEGYAAVTSRKVAARAGLKPQLVHYYFRTMDDLYLALFRRGAEQNLERFAAAVSSPRPLHALWDLSSEKAGTALLTEFTALANHRATIREEIAEYAERYRQMHNEAIGAIFERYGLDSGRYPPPVLTMFMVSLSQVMVMEEALGVTTGHAETLKVVEDFLELFEGDGAAPPTASGTARRRPAAGRR